MGIENYLHEDTIRHEAKVDLKKIESFRKEHDEHDRKPSPAATGATYSYSYHPTSVGTIIEITCRCGAKLDATDYDSFG